MRTVIVAVVFAALGSAAQAQSANGKGSAASVARARACIAATQSRHLTSVQYKAFMNECLVSKRPPAELFENARTIERRCNMIANDRQISGIRRDQFMQSCRKKGG